MSTTQFAIANGDINICRVVVADTTIPNGVVQATVASVIPLGVAWDRSKLEPNPNYTSAQLAIAANAGDGIGVFTDGDICSVYCNDGSITPGIFVMTDGNGKAITGTSGHYMVGRAQSAGVADTLLTIEVKCTWLN